MHIFLITFFSLFLIYILFFPFSFHLTISTLLRGARASCFISSSSLFSYFIIIPRYMLCSFAYLLGLTFFSSVLLTHILFLPLPFYLTISVVLPIAHALYFISSSNQFFYFITIPNYLFCFYSYPLTFFCLFS